MGHTKQEQVKQETTFEPSRSWRASIALMAGVTVFALDYIVKVFVRNTLAVTGESVSVLPGILSFRFVANTGAAFSMGEGMGLLFAAFAVVVVAGIAWYLSHEARISRLEVFALGLVAGGALGNALDRVLLGYVVDFIATDFIDFPVFNIADIGVTVGVALAFVGFMFLSPAAKVDATAELDARDARAAERRLERRARQARKLRDRRGSEAAGVAASDSNEQASDGQGVGSAPHSSRDEEPVGARSNGGQPGGTRPRGTQPVGTQNPSRAKGKR